MNVKALAAIVGTLSLGALATGCASSKAAENPSGTVCQAEEKGAERACQINVEAAGKEGSTATKATGSLPAERR